MKTQVLKTIMLLVMATVAIGSSAQIKLKSNGMTVIGSEPTDAVTDSLSTLKIYPKSGATKGGIISFGTASSVTPVVAIGEYGDANSGKLWLHGASGLSYTSIDSTEVIRHSYSSSTHRVIFNSNVTVNGTLMVPKPVYDIFTDSLESSPLDILSDIAPVATVSAVSTQDDLSVHNYDLDIEGLEATFPGSVYADSCGNTYVDYIRLIPVLVNAINELKAQLDAAGSGSGTVITPLSAKGNGTASADRIDADVITPKLYQNTPNPFNAETEIRYALPHDVATAVLYIYDMQGTQIRRYGIDGRGEGSVKVSASSLKAGMYIYALVADGKEIDTKRMILTR